MATACPTVQILVLVQMPFVTDTASAARKVDTKVANLLPKVAQKVATLKNRFKTSLKQAFKINIFKLYYKAGSKPVKNWF